VSIRLETVVVAIGLAIVAGLIFAFAALTAGVNVETSSMVRDAPKPAHAPDLNAIGTPPAEATPADSAATTPDEEASPPADVVAPTVTADAPVVLGTVSMLTNTAREYIQLDAATCNPGTGSVEVRRGEVKLQMHGIEGPDCLVDYATNNDGDNPDGAWTATCRIPTKAGKIKLKTRDDGADFSPIAIFCSES
jgi:hypothetical protein